MPLKIKLHEEAPSTVVSFPGQPSDTYMRMLAEIESLNLKKLDSEHWTYRRDAAEGVRWASLWGCLFCTPPESVGRVSGGGMCLRGVGVWLPHTYITEYLQAFNRHV